MKLPLWVYDYQQKQYVQFPFELLTTLPDGSRGFVFYGSPEHRNLLSRWGHLFIGTLEDIKLEDIKQGPTPAPKGVGGFYWWVYRLRERRDPTKSKGPRRYSDENHQIKKYKRTRP